MVFICLPLSRRAIQLSPLIFTLAIFLTPYQCWKGSGFKKEVWVHCPTPWGLPPGMSWAWLLLSEGSGLPSLVPSPPNGLKVTLLLMLLLMGSCRWSTSNCYNTSNASLPSECLSQPSQGAPWIPPWPHWYHLGPCFPLHLSWHSPLPGVSSTQWVF